MKYKSNKCAGLEIIILKPYSYSNYLNYGFACKQIVHEIFYIKTCHFCTLVALNCVQEQYIRYRIIIYSSSLELPEKTFYMNSRFTGTFFHRKPISHEEK